MHLLPASETWWTESRPDAHRAYLVELELEQSAAAELERLHTARPAA